MAQWLLVSVVALDQRGHEFDAPVGSCGLITYIHLSVHVNSYIGTPLFVT